MKNFEIFSIDLSSDFLAAPHKPPVKEGDDIYKPKPTKPTRPTKPFDIKQY